MESLPVSFPPPATSQDSHFDSASSEMWLPANYSTSSDQACKECRRRKARCNRALPTCDLCIKYRRHCLYEKHSKTPLTRKHLTDVETRLERAEAMLKQMRRFMPPNAAPQGTAMQTDESAMTFNGGLFSPTAQVAGGTVAAGSDPVHEPSPEAITRAGTVSDSASRQFDFDNQQALEDPPLDDFEWNETDSPASFGAVSEDPGQQLAADDTQISDGMASLSVVDREAGYLGVTSGAAMLKLVHSGTPRRNSKTGKGPSIFMTPQVSPNRLITEVMIDAYFRFYHVCYPLVHEPTFRAQYSEVIPRPHGSCWTALAYVIASIGVWISGKSTDNLDLALFAHARSIFGFTFMEVGNLSLVQALILASNYQQKRDKPNSGYNYLGLSSRMAMGLGLHKEFQGWDISPLNMEVRRRIWWTLCCFDIGATITFSRPDVWPYKGVEVSYPLNVQDKDLTVASQNYPVASTEVTPYTAIINQAHFHMATRKCYDRMISKPIPTATELLHMEAEEIGDWRSQVPPYFDEDAVIPSRYSLPQAIIAWRVRNLRIIMYRPFVIRRAVRRRPDSTSDDANTEAYNRCLADAKSTIEMIDDYWTDRERNRLSAWYGLYFLFQAALIPCVCLRNDPTAAQSSEWRKQLSQTIKTMKAMRPFNASSARCYETISDLCGQYLEDSYATNLQASAGMSSKEQDVLVEPAAEHRPDFELQPVGESPETQLNNMWSLMFPNVSSRDAADVNMTEDSGWMEFLRADSLDEWPGQRGENTV